jgi:hypothetical protein
MTSTRGTERMRFTYAPAGRPSSRKLDSRIMASSVPKITPPSMASPVRVSVKVMPSLNR